MEVKENTVYLTSSEKNTTIGKIKGLLDLAVLTNIIYHQNHDIQDSDVFVDTLDFKEDEKLLGLYGLVKGFLSRGISSSEYMSENSMFLVSEYFGGKKIEVEQITPGIIDLNSDYSRRKAMFK